MSTEGEITPEEFTRIQEEEFGVSPEEKARIHAKLSATLADLRAGRLRSNSLSGVIHEFGEERFDEALPEIVSFLTSPNERVRYMALDVLTFHFQLKDYKTETMFEQALPSIGHSWTNTYKHGSVIQ